MRDYKSMCMIPNEKHHEYITSITLTNIHVMKEIGQDITKSTPRTMKDHGSGLETG